MPKIDLTITVSVIVALAAVISPIFTAIINNHYQLKLKKIESKQKEYEQTILYKRNIFENYLRYLNEVAQHPTNEALSGYAQYYPLTYMYVSQEVQDKMSKVNHALNQSVHHSGIIESVDSIITDISKELQKL